MVLVLDIGNSNVVFGVFKGESLSFTARISTVKERTGDEWAVYLRSILAEHGVNGRDIEGAAISSVVPPITRPLSEAVELVCLSEPIIVGPGIKTGLEILIDNPAQLGSDMVSNAVAAIAQYPKPIIIFDMGTATTISVINEKGQFLGGAIVPGVRTSLEALSQRAAQLPHIAIEAPARVVGANTVESMQSGIVYGTASMIDGMAKRIEAETGFTATVVATGGLSREICRHVAHRVEHNADLLLQGLYLLYNKNKKK